MVGRGYNYQVFARWMGLGHRYGGVMSQTQENEGRGLKVLAISYLVWEAFQSVVGTVLLALVTAAYAGAYPVEGELSLRVPMLGGSVSVWVLIVAGWVVLALSCVIGVALGVEALLLSTRMRRSRHTVVLGRVVVAVNVAAVLVSLVQASAPFGLASIVSLLLSGTVALQVRSCEDSGAEPNPEVGEVPKRSFLVDVAQHTPEREAGLNDAELQVFRLVGGYSTIMLVWGALRILMGLASLFASPAAQSVPNVPVVRLAVSAYLVASGVYFLVVGRVGKRSLFGGSSLHAFFVMGAIGLVLSALALVTYLVWQVMGWEPAARDVFVSAIDLALFGLGCVYARKLETLGFDHHRA